MNGLDPERPESWDERIVVVPDVVGVAPPGGFQVAQQSAQLLELDVVDPGVGGEPDQPEEFSVGKHDR